MMWKKLSLLSMPLIGMLLFVVPLHAVDIGQLNPNTITKEYCESGAKHSEKVTLPFSGQASFDAIEHFLIKTVPSTSPNTNCPEKRTASDTKPIRIDSSSIEASKLFAGATFCGSSTSSKAKLCFYGTEDLIANIDFTYDTRVAKELSESDFTITESDQKLTFEFTNQAPTNTKSILFCISPVTAAEMDVDTDCVTYGPPKTFDVNSALVIEDLTNDQEYAIKIATVSQSDTKSKYGKAFLRTPLKDVSVMELYNGGGGDIEFGGCNAQATNKNLYVLLSIVVLGLLVVIGRKRRNESSRISMLALLIVVCMNVMPKPAHARIGQLNLGLNFSPYFPNIDGELRADGTFITPIYKKFFSTDKHVDGPWLPLIGPEVLVHVFDGFGSLQLGAALAYTFASGKARKASDFNQAASAPVRMHLLQLRPEVRYVFDPYVHIVPLAPYLRADLIVNGYGFTVGGELDRRVEAIPASGIRFGWEVAAGLMLMMDFLEPPAARTGRTGLLNHVYLKADVSYTSITGFGSRGFNFSQKDFLFGSSLPIMLNVGLVFELM